MACFNKYGKPRARYLGLKKGEHFFELEQGPGFPAEELSYKASKVLDKLLKGKDGCFYPLQRDGKVKLKGK